MPPERGFINMVYQKPSTRATLFWNRMAEIQVKVKSWATFDMRATSSEYRQNDSRSQERFRQRSSKPGSGVRNQSTGMGSGGAGRIGALESVEYGAGTHMQGRTIYAG